MLDASRGEPARGVVVDLHLLRDGERLHLATAATNADGRTSEPLLSGKNMQSGVYELTFHAGDYFRAMGASLADPPFLDQVVIRFGVADAAANYSAAASCALQLQHLPGIIVDRFILGTSGHRALPDAGRVYRAGGETTRTFLSAPMRAVHQYLREWMERTG